MPVDISLLLKIAENIKNFLGDQDKSKLAKNDRLKTALLAVLTAANETRSYLADMKEKKRQDRETETRLAALWTKASVELLEFDKDLAGICKLSGEYWSDPKAWSYREINAVKRVLHVISDRAQRLMTI